MMTVKKFVILSVAKISALLYAIFGLIAGLFVALFYALGSVFAGDFGPLGFELGFFSIIVFPIAYGVLGFIGGIVGAALYNLVAHWVGGIQVELEQ